jgi:hypothetical protein
VLILVGFRSLKLSAMEGSCEFLEVLISVDLKTFIINRSETHVRGPEIHEELLEVFVLGESRRRLARGLFLRVIRAEMCAARHGVREFWGAPFRQVGTRRTARRQGFSAVSEGGCLQVTPEGSMYNTDMSTIIHEVFEYVG